MQRLIIPMISYLIILIKHRQHYAPKILQTMRHLPPLFITKVNLIQSLIEIIRELLFELVKVLLLLIMYK